MGSTLHATCNACGSEFTFDQGGGFCFHLLRCDTCGTPKSISFETLVDLHKRYLNANRRLAESGLVTLTWGNTSGIDRRQGLVAIKPSGIPYERLEPGHLVVVDLEGRVVEGELRPSSDTATHLMLYLLEKHYGRKHGPDAYYGQA